MNAVIGRLAPIRDDHRGEAGSQTSSLSLLLNNSPMTPTHRAYIFAFATPSPFQPATRYSGATTSTTIIQPTCFTPPRSPARPLALALLVKIRSGTSASNTKTQAAPAYHHQNTRRVQPHQNTINEGSMVMVRRTRECENGQTPLHHQFAPPEFYHSGEESPAATRLATKHRCRRRLATVPASGIPDRRSV